MSRIDPAELDDLKARQPVYAVAGDWTTLRAYRGPNRKGFTHGGPCPLCSSGSGKKTNKQFECNAESFVCAACGKGGDVVALVMEHDGVDFRDAIDRLGGTREARETPATCERAGRQAFAAGKARAVPDGLAADAALARAWLAGFDKAFRQAQAQARYREAERARLFKTWQSAVAWQGSPVETYLRARGLRAPENARLRYLADAPYFEGETVDDAGRRSPRVIYRGPAMIAAILDAAGKFRGLHYTWFDLAADAAPKFKARIVDPDSGEVLVSKKARGTKQGGYIDLGGEPHAPNAPHGERPVYFTRQFSGEGIESTLAVYTAMVTARRSIAGIVWRAGIDLGNLVGSAADTVRHPDLKVTVRARDGQAVAGAGRARNVPGDVPDMASPAMPVAPGVRELVQLADGDSDPFTTRCAMARGEARRRAEGLAVRTLWPTPGTDFNSMLKPELDRT